MSVFLQRLLKQVRASEAPRRERLRRRSFLAVEQLEPRELLDAGLNAGFITNLYIDLLRRIPGAPELSSWQAAIQAGATPQGIVQGFLGSNEYRSDLIQGDYLTFLGRQGSPPDVANWLQSGLTQEPIESQFLGSNESYSRNGSTAPSWLQAVYSDVLGRSADAGGLTFWESQLTAGVSRLTVALDLVNSSESHGCMVTIDYDNLLGRTPDPQGLAFWTTLLNEGGDPSSVLTGILTSPEYRKKSLATKTTLTSPTNPTVFGQSIALIAKVADSGLGNGIPYGTVNFLDGSTPLGSANISAGGATLTVSTLTVGTHSFSAAYQGAAGYAPSTSTGLSQTVKPAATSTKLTSSANPVASGQPTTFTATVAAVSPGTGVPTGSVTFLDGTTTLGSVALSNGQASLAFSWAAFGTHAITATYSATASFRASTSSTLSQVIGFATNTIIVSSTDPVVSGQPVTFTAAVAPSASNLAVPTGTVIFTVDGVALPPMALVNGLATLTQPTLIVGNHSVVAAYSGDPTFKPSTSATFTEVSNASYVAPWQAPGVNVTKSGIVGDGVTDDTTALQNLINSSTAGTLFYFPAGTYVVSGTVDFHALGTFGIEGDTTAAGLPASVIKGTATSGVAVSVDYGSSGASFQIKNMQFTGSDAGETAFFTANASDASFENCAFSGHIGLDLQTGFVVAVRSCKFNGDGSAAGSHIGLLAWLPTESLVAGCDFTGWDEGIRAAGAGLSVIRSTFEENGTALRLGADPNGNNWGFTRSALNDLTLKDNDTALYAQSIGFCSFSNISIQGSANAPSGQSKFGLFIAYAQGCTFSGLQIDGGYSDAAAYVSVVGGPTNHSTFYACNASNSIPTGLAWEVAPGLTAVDFFTNPLPNAIADVDDPTASAIVPGVQGPVLKVTNYGIVGDNATDNTAKLQALINTATPGTLFYFPKGIYIVSATIDFSRLSIFGLLGDSASSGSNSGSTIIGNFARVLFKADYGTGTGVFQMRNLNLNSSQNAGAVCLYARNAVFSSMENIQVTGNIGIDLENPFHIAMSSVKFNGYGVSNSNIGLLMNGGTDVTVEEGDFTAWREALRAAGSGLMVYASRFEVNHIGMNLGVDPSGNSSPLLNASFAGISMEANDIFINAVNCSKCSFGGIGTQGSPNAPSGMTQVGLFVGASQGCTFSGIGMGGAYSDVSIRVSSAASNLLFDACSAVNGLGGATWDVQSGAINVTVLACY